MSDREYTTDELSKAVKGMFVVPSTMDQAVKRLADSLGLKIKEELPRPVAIRTMMPAESVVIMDAATGRAISVGAVDEVARRYGAVERALDFLVQNATETGGGPLLQAVDRILREDANGRLIPLRWPLLDGLVEAEGEES